VIILHKTVEPIEVMGPEFGVSQPLRFHVYNSARPQCPSPKTIDSELRRIYRFLRQLL